MYDMISQSIIYWKIPRGLTEVWSKKALKAEEYFLATLGGNRQKQKQKPKIANVSCQEAWSKP